MRASGGSGTVPVCRRPTGPWVRRPSVRLPESLRRLGDQRGTTLILFAVALTMMLAMAAFAVDVGLLYLRRAQAQLAVDAAALAGAQDLPDTVQAEQTVLQYLAANLDWLSAPEYDAQVTVEFPSDQGRKLVRLSLSASPPAIFGRLFGHELYAASRGGAAESASLDVALVLDRSGSMCRDSHGLMLDCPVPGPWQPFDDMRDAAKAFVELFNPLFDRTGLVSYSSNAALDNELTDDYQGAASAVQQAIDGMLPTGYTNIGQAIEVAQDELNGPRAREFGRKIIVLLTDGVANRYWNGSGWSTCGGSGCSQARDYTLQKAQEAAGDGIVIHTIGLGTTADTDLLQDIAQISGGRFYFAPSAGELGEVFAAIADLANTRLVE